MKKKRPPAARVRRFLRKLLGLPRADRTRPGPLVEGPVFQQLWAAAAAASPHRRQFSIRQPNVLLFQMGKVASSALSAVLLDQGINCFHCHDLRHDVEASRLSRLFGSPPDLALASRELNLLVKNTALNMLVRWYRANELPADRKLKVLTLTRDPVSWFSSHLLQRFGYDARALLDWHRQAYGGGGEVGEAAAEMLRQVAGLVLEARPSLDLEAARSRAMALALARTPEQPCLVKSIGFVFGPVRWFDRQFTPIFGIDVQDLSELRESGLAHRDLGSIEVLVVRFEDLAQNLDVIARYLGVPRLELPPKNVTARKPHAGPVLDATRRLLDTELGIAFQQELRGTKYGQACGYDRMQR